MQHVHALVQIAHLARENDGRCLPRGVPRLSEGLGHGGHRRRQTVRALRDSVRRRVQRRQHRRHRHLGPRALGNVVEEEDSWRFSFIDLDDVWVYPENHAPSRNDWVLALAQINPSTPKILPWTDRLRFLKDLAEPCKFDKKPFIREIQELSRQPGRAYFSEDGVVEIDFI